MANTSSYRRCVGYIDERSVEAIQPDINFDDRVLELPVQKRECRDSGFLILFIAFLSFLHSNPNLVIHGYDNYGNICGQPNKPLPNVTNSGQNKTNFPYLLIESIQNSSIKTKCVNECPKDGFFEYCHLGHTFCIELNCNQWICLCLSQLLTLKFDEKQREFQQHLVDQWFVAGIAASVLTVVFIFIVTVMRKRIKLVAILFREAGKAISDMPFLLLQPVWATRFPVIDPITGFVSYNSEPFYKYMKWYHMFGYLWSVHFILSCQHFIISGSVALWFFKRSKQSLDCPLLHTIAILIRYHIGSILFGSLLIASVKAIRFIVKRLDALNALRVLALNSVGDFLLFVAKICVVTAVAFIGIELIEEKSHSLHYYWSPIIASALFAYFVSHCFLSVYEMAIDTLFLCFIEDCQQNDGLRKPYFMSNSLMGFIESNYHKNEN
ncbi:unnamed protein product [Medioppia subpectinata]|uniref:Choline transporter-like protein n=1 Tax=Medioppia subpectinata TaxID=1979941 RepID=A0A7R9KQK5_9ACAR|nr:unnamed protein product [Medioppia subpectinata]CAG2106593.1 unnamed protein product [Medioppia subpectinata]